MDTRLKVDIHGSCNIVVLRCSRCEAYKLDACYGEKDGNTAHIFAAEMNHVIRKVMDGQNATVFAHGAYGSGKTYTMKVMFLALNCPLVTPHCLCEQTHISSAICKHLGFKCQNSMKLFGMS
jgi:hypothetical protein